MNPVRKYKKKVYKAQRLMYRNNLIKTNYYMGRIVETACVTDFNISLNTSGQIITQFSANNYVNFVTILNQSVFATDYQSYGRYKILNVSVSLTPIDSLSGYTINFLQSPAVACCVFPNTVNLNLGTLIKDNDNSFVAYGGLNYTQAKQWNFDNGFLTDKNLGLGTWNNSLDYGLQMGQISFLEVTGSNSAIVSAKSIFTVRVRFTVQFSLFSI